MPALRQTKLGRYFQMYIYRFYALFYLKTSNFTDWYPVYLFLCRNEKKKHCGRGTHICISNLTIIGSDNDLSPDRRHAIILIIARILLIGPLRINFSEILFKMWAFSFKKMRLKISSAKWCLFRLGLDVLKHISSLIYGVIIPFPAAGSLYVRPYPATQLSWHVQNLVTVIFLQFGLDVFIEIEMWRRNRWWVRSQFRQMCPNVKHALISSVWFMCKTVIIPSFFLFLLLGVPTDVIYLRL